MSTVRVTPNHVPLALIDVDENVRELDEAHVEALAGSIALRGLISPLTLRPDAERFTLVAGFHRYAACQRLGLKEVRYELTDREGTSADSAAENIVRKQLNPLEEARAVQRMFNEHYTGDGAASVLGWSRALVTARAKILELPAAVQQLLGNGGLPVSAVDVLLAIQKVSPELCEAAVAPVAAGDLDGSRLVREPGYAIGLSVRSGATKAWLRYLNTLNPGDIADLRLGKKAEREFAECEQLHRQLSAYAYGPPTIQFGELEVDQARAIGVLIEFDGGRAPIVTDRSVFRDLAKQAISRTLQELRARIDQRKAEQASRKTSGQAPESPQEQLESEHRANVRDLARRAHGVNLDLGASLFSELANVDPDNLDLARFLVYGLLGQTPRHGRETIAQLIAATGISLVMREHRTETTRQLKSGQPGKTKISYSQPEDAEKWLWKWIDSADTAGVLFGRGLVAFACQHYASQLVLAQSKRRGSALPGSRNDTARKAFERLTKRVLPATHRELRRAIEREASEYTKHSDEIQAARRRHAAVQPAEEPDTDAQDTGLEQGDE